MSESGRILVVDDDPIAREALEALLFAEGLELAFASSGAEALARIGQVAPDVILLDVMMPGMTGFQVCTILRQDPAWQRIPIILVTALGDRESLVCGLDAGADDFLSKPVNGPELRARVRSMLRIKKQYDLLEEQRQELVRVARIKEELAAVNARRLEELESLQGVGLRLMNSLDMAYIVEEVCRTALKVVPGAAHCVLHFLSDDEQGMSLIVYAAHDPSQSAPAAVGIEAIIRRAVMLKEVVYVPDVMAEPECSPAYEMRALLVSPLVVDMRCIGTVSVDSAEANAFGIVHCHLLSILASQTAVALMKARLFEALDRAPGPQENNG